MECQVCKIRSAVGRCEESNQLVCEECSTGCYRCGKRMAVTAGHQTRSGHLYCSVCYEERAARKAARRQGEPEGGGLIDDEAPVRATRPAEEPEMEEEAVLSRWEAVAPWKMSLYLAGVAILLSVFFMIFPGYRAIPLGGEYMFSYIPLGLLALFLASMGAIWGIIGMVGQQFFAERNRSIIGLVFAVIAGILAVAVTKPPPTDPDAAVIGASQPRQFGTETERAQWRERYLQGDRTNGE